MKIVLSSRRHHYVTRVSIFLVMVALIAAMTGCGRTPLQYDLTISSTAGGSVTTPGEGTNTYDEGTVVNLTAEAEEGYRFVSWTGDVGTIADVNAAATNITMNDSYSITANFVAVYGLTIYSTAGGSVTTPGEGTFTYDEGKVVSLVATPASGYYFVEWTGDVGTVANVIDPTTKITMNGHYSITAKFDRLFAGGSGTKEDPYQIADWHHLDHVDYVRNYLNHHFIVINDLDSTTAGYTRLASKTANAGKGWQPIGTSSDPFTGTFDGQGHEIRDLFIERPDENYVGLFSDVDEGGIIKNVGVVNADVTGHSYVGGLVAKNNDSTVRDCYSTGSATGYAFVGGLVGWNSAHGTVLNSHFTGSASGYPGYPFVGGLAGANSGSVTNSSSTGSVTGYTAAGGLAGMNQGTVSNSYSTGNVTGDEDVGGLVGKNQRTVSNSYSTGNVTGYTAVGGLVGWNQGTVEENSYSTGNVTGDADVGGLLGWNDGTVDSSYSTGNVTGSYCVGGLVGKNQDTVTNSYATGNVTGYAAVGGLAGDNHHDGTVEESYSTGNVTGYVAVGGLVGRNYYATVTNSYSTGNVTGYDVDVGGLVGTNYYATVTNSFWDIETSGQATSDGGTGKNTTEMKDITTFTGATWDIVLIGDYVDETWYIDDENDYPRLGWQSV